MILAVHGCRRPRQLWQSYMDHTTKRVRLWPDQKNHQIVHANVNLAPIPLVQLLNPRRQCPSICGPVHVNMVCVGGQRVMPSSTRVHGAGGGGRWDAVVTEIDRDATQSLHHHHHQQRYIACMLVCSTRISVQRNQIRDIT